MQSWVVVLLEKFPEFVLGGFTWEECAQWQAMFSWFWKTYQGYDGDHPIFLEDFDRSLCIPIATHGDEGRGFRQSAFMVESFQFVLSYKGPRMTNMSGQPGQSFKHMFCTVSICDMWICVLPCVG